VEVVDPGRVVTLDFVVAVDCVDATGAEAVVHPARVTAHAKSAMTRTASPLRPSPSFPSDCHDTTKDGGSIGRALRVTVRFVVCSFTLRDD
jgi:hypothetical protein